NKLERQAIRVLYLPHVFMAASSPYPCIMAGGGAVRRYMPRCLCSCFAALAGSLAAMVRRRSYFICYRILQEESIYSSSNVGRWRDYRAMAGDGVSERARPVQEPYWSGVDNKRQGC